MEIFQPDIFPFSIAIGQINDAKEFVDEDHKEIVVNESALGVTIRAYRIDKENNKEYPYALIVFPSKPSVATIAHEAYHAATALLENIHVYASAASEEVFAYLIGYISDCIDKTVQKIWA